MTKKYKFLAYEGLPTINPPDHNVPINLNLNVKTDEELVFHSNYKFNVDITKLLTPSKKSKCARKNKKYGTGKPPKPPNCFVIYMRDNYNRPEFYKMKAKDRLPKIRDRWRREPKKIKELYEACARIAKKERYQRMNGTSSPNSSNTSMSPLSNSADTSSPSPPNYPAISSPSNSPVTPMPPLSYDTSSSFPFNSTAMSSSLSYHLDISLFPPNSNPPAISSPSLSYSHNTSSSFPLNSSAISPSPLIPPTTSSSFLESEGPYFSNAGFDNDNIQLGISEPFSTFFPEYSSISTNFTTTPSVASCDLYQHSNYDQINNVNCDVLSQINNAQQYDCLNTDYNSLNSNEELDMGNLQVPDYEYFILAIPNRGLANRNLPKLTESNNFIFLEEEIYRKHTESNNFIEGKRKEEEIYQKHTESNNFIFLEKEIYQKHTESNNFIIS